MGELVWGIKNGDIDQVKDIIEQKVKLRIYHRISGNVLIHQPIDYIKRNERKEYY